MMSKIKKNKKEIVLLAVVIFQIFLLVNMIAANSYIIHKTDSLTETKIIKEKNKFNLINSGLNLLVGLLSIKQIGIVSAQEDWCCEEINNATCQPIGSEDSCAGQTWMTDCESTDLCKTGTCVDEEEGTCSVGTKKGCEDNWEDNPIDEVFECQLGCCILDDGAKKIFTRNIQCTTQGGVFDSSTSQLDCRVYTKEMGACVLNDGGCQFVTENTCATLDGDFYLKTLCSHPDLNNNCAMSLPIVEVETTCYNDKVYFLDNCSNIANVYDVSKLDDLDYWKKVQNSSCGDGKDSQTCGNCDGLTSMCAPSSEAGVNPDYGDYACEDLSCEDDYFEEKYERPPQNGESWCIYESYIGESRDVVGSEHRRRWCDRGEIKVEACGEYRMQICGEKTTGEYSVARCRANEGWRCFQIEPVAYEFEDDGEISNEDDIGDFNDECDSLSDCRVQQVDLHDEDAPKIYADPGNYYWHLIGDDQAIDPLARSKEDGEYSNFFIFDVCVPEYPAGLKFWEAEDKSNDLCSIASVSCPTSWVKGVFHTQCRGNCNCLDQKFADEMNEFCTSIGDCGGYVNTEGKYTKNFRTFDIDKLDDDDAYWIYVLMAGEYSKWPLFTADGDIGEGSGEEYARDDQIGKGNPPKFFSSTEQDWIGNALDAIEPGLDYTNPGLAIGIVMGGLSGVATIVAGLITSAVVAAATEGLVGAAATTAAAAAAVSPGPVIGWIIAIVLIILTAVLALIFGPGGVGSEEEIDVEFTCKPWQPPTNPDKYDCSICDDNKPCTEYKCRSLGSGCRFISKDELYETEESICINQYRDDSTPPKISLNELDGGLYSDSPRPGGNGIEIRNSSGGCIQEFTEINFSLITKEGSNEDYAKCVYNWKPVAPNATEDYTLEGEEFKEGNSYSVLHRFENRLPFVSSLDVISGTLGERWGELNMYVRCEDYAGNPNFNEYIVNFCIKEGEDIEHARIKENGFSPESGSYLEYNITEKILTISLDEPAECKWTHDTDKSYDEMETFTSCDDYHPWEMKSRWDCSTTLTNLTKPTNNIYIKCKDQPWVCDPTQTGCDYDGPWNENDRNVNMDGFPYTLYATENELQIVSISPQGEIRRGSVPTEADDLRVTTSGGMANGISRCEYDFVEPPLGWDFFAQEDTYHIYPLHPSAGNYNVLIVCKDEAGNKAEGNAIFNLIIDDLPPMVVRAYQDGGSLKLITDEEAKCYYDLNRCSFNLENGTSMTTAFSTVHTTTWNPDITYHVKCKDVFDNTNSDCAIKIIPSS